MNESNESPLTELLDVEDAIRPVIVTISHDDKPEPEGPMLVGFRIRSWGCHFQIVPKVCWMETSGRPIQCSIVPGDDMNAARLTAVMAIADQLADNVRQQHPSNRN